VMISRTVTRSSSSSSSSATLSYVSAGSACGALAILLVVVLTRRRRHQRLQAAVADPVFSEDMYAMPTLHVINRETWKNSVFDPAKSLSNGSTCKSDSSNHAIADEAVYETVQPRLESDS
jgi:hypothetical protein